jgi:Helix-turn-helix domain
MRRTTMLWEAFVSRFEEAFGQYKRRRLTSEEAGELLGMSGRHFRRLCVRYEEDGIEGLRDHRIGKVSPRRAPARELERMHELYRERYHDFTVKHFHEQLVRRHNYQLCYTVTRLSLQSAGLVPKAKRRGAHRKKRVRRPLPGMLLFQDGSKHRWIASFGRDLDLIVTLDDATGEIYSAFLIDEEGTMSSFLGLAETIVGHGLFSTFYTDRGGHYFITRQGSRKVDKTQLTQVGRALSQLGITHIASYSPQGRGRMERVFGTLQKRLPQELRLARIKTVAAANRYLKDRFVPDYNARFAVPAAEPGSAFVRYVGRPIEDVLCVQEDRVVGADNCVSWRRRSLQIPPQHHRQHYVRATVRVHEYPDGHLAIFDGPRCLARFDPKGRADDVASQAA